MSKPRKYGYFKPVVQNNRGDLRFHKKLYQRAGKQLCAVKGGGRRNGGRIEN